MQQQESTSPPGWARTLLQQIAQTQAMQNEERERRHQQDAAQEERMRRLEAMLEQQASPAATTTTTNEEQATPARSAAESVPIPPRTETIHRPKPRLPDPKPFGGSTSDWPTWRISIENKLSVDGEAIGSPQDQFIYVFSRLEKLAWKNTGTFVKLRRNTGEPQALLDFLESIYGDPNIKARAARRLHQIRQPEDMSFSRFLPRLEKEFADADALEWHDEAKRQILLSALNKTMTNALMNRGIPATSSGLISRLHEISSDIDALNINREERTRRPRSTRQNSDEMDWAPTVSVNRAEPHTKHRRPESGTPKQAQWVSQDEIDQRRAEGKCLRCGRSGHLIARCALLPAQRPNSARIATSSSKKEKGRTVKVKRSKPTSDLDLTTSDDESVTTEDNSEKE
ncbi:retrotransposon gag protein [Penicillium subrubescens]|uniref:retrotransposon gag protein n=1 Tax=Penicillium subrubescens TaxID=1316194 RepID=UPI00254561EC|nr:retrotransposon gag protein [Penicillium subrubescens]KAJ5880163.1 retrotransposon gag protein [Penicillium subrubescens]